MSEQNSKQNFNWIDQFLEKYQPFTRRIEYLSFSGIWYHQIESTRKFWGLTASGLLLIHWNQTHRSVQR